MTTSTLIFFFHACEYSMLKVLSFCKQQQNEGFRYRELYIITTS